MRDSKHDPLTLWQASIAAEVDSCAFTASFAADYKDKRNVNLTRHSNSTYVQYGEDVARAYSALPRGKRNFFRDAILPCFAEIRYFGNYAQGTLSNVKLLADIAKTSSDIALRNIRLAKAGRRAYDPADFRTDVDPPSQKEKIALLAGLFKDSFQTDAGTPEIDALRRDPQKFLEWIDEQTRPGLPSMLQEIKASQRRYSTLRNKVLLAENQLQKKGESGHHRPTSP